jgi:hypothetical protein
MKRSLSSSLVSSITNSLGGSGIFYYSFYTSKLTIGLATGYSLMTGDASGVGISLSSNLLSSILKS